MKKTTHKKYKFILWRKSWCRYLLKARCFIITFTPSDIIRHAPKDLNKIINNMVINEVNVNWESFMTNYLPNGILFNLVNAIPFYWWWCVMALRHAFHKNICILYTANNFIMRKFMTWGKLCNKRRR